MKKKEAQRIKKFILYCSILLLVFSFLEFVHWIPPSIRLDNMILFLDRMAVFTLISGVIGILYYFVGDD